jgi:hypothetical protein
MARTTFPAITTTTEWVNATAINGDTLGQTPAGKAASKLISSFQLISAADIKRETDKAIGIAGTRWNTCGNPEPTIVWMPKSQARELANDYWVNCAARMFLVPTWLVDAKAADGYEIN